MKKYLKISLIYAVAAMCCGVFYREFTKYMGFTGVTALGRAHAHLFMLGMFIFLLIAVLSKSLSFEISKTFKLFMVTYNIGLALTAVMFIVRGVLQVMETSLSKGLDASISGIAGIGHICLGTGLVLLFVSLIGAVKEEPNE